MKQGDSGTVGQGDSETGTVRQGDSETGRQWDNGTGGQ